MTFDNRHENKSCSTCPKPDNLTTFTGSQRLSDFQNFFLQQQDPPLLVDLSKIWFPVNNVSKSGKSSEPNEYMRYMRHVNHMSQCDVHCIVHPETIGTTSEIVTIGTTNEILDHIGQREIFHFHTAPHALDSR